MGDNPEPAYTPDPRVANNETSVTLIFLANRAIYPQPVEDPWFNAMTALTPNSTTGTGRNEQNETFYYSSEPGSVLGCVNDLVLCNPNIAGSDGCVDWTDFAEMNVGISTTTLDCLKLNEHQQELAQALATLLYNSEYWNILDALGTSALTASNFLYGFGSVLSLPLGPTQWIAELQRLQAASMSILQRDAFTSVAGPSDRRLTIYLTGSSSWTCGIQKFKSTAYMTFSVLGLGLIFGIGGLILLLGIFITGIAPRLPGRSDTRRGMFRRQQWHTNDVLHLQKTIFEDRETGGEWEEKSFGCVPTTKNSQKFLPLTDMPPPPPSPLIINSQEKRSHEDDGLLTPSSSVEKAPAQQTETNTAGAGARRSQPFLVSHDQS